MNIDIDDLLEEVMIFEATTGKMAMVKITKSFLAELRKSEVGFFKTDKYIAGIPYIIDENIPNGYIVCFSEV